MHKPEMILKWVDRLPNLEKAMLMDNIEVAKKESNHGGKRPNAGRKKGTPKTGGRKKGSAGRRLHITIPQPIAQTLPDSDAAARAEILERISKEKQQ